MTFIRFKSADANGVGVKLLTLANRFALIFALNSQLNGKKIRLSAISYYTSAF